ncbi:hypothetical protein HYT54_01515 [Candidatus Woesearchaeota archaeon]|nr:hypothetical protein [Candidatus Woesearchaeota archaeon]
MDTKPWAVMMVVFTTFLTASAQIMYKLGVNSLDSFDPVRLITNFYLIAGMVLYMIGGVLMILSFRGGDLSVLYPIIATGFIWVSIMSMIFLGEGMNNLKWLGIFGIVLGIAFIGFGSRHNNDAAAGGA